MLDNLQSAKVMVSLILEAMWVFTIIIIIIIIIIINYYYYYHYYSFI